MFEIEMKARVKSLQAIKEKLIKLHAKWIKQQEKIDLYFAPQTLLIDKINFYKDSLFRLRTVSPNSHFVTFKQKKIEEGLEINREVEFQIDNPDSFQEFAQLIGYCVAIEKDKKTDLYQMDELNIELNEVKDLGYFVEVEYLSDQPVEPDLIRKKILTLFEQLGINQEEIEPRYYIDLLREYSVK